ncbi:hypothetical protein J0A67_13775 [Algoriphagus aestuariicola]|uniref:Outer membrane protein beta-barrel domain-containing protein n=1 Tax=Algoriphagus aestuariicola TaxID=1852016 RepID=A0ABS3BS87_9BACT|nr:hypothetical protein [Algoriphagus aestuariicola]MBN7801937.1 hypothetical protein [Algoriphagus aestuariicola]
MKKLLLMGAFLLAGIVANAQTTRDLEDINEDNSWLKLGLNIAAPVGDQADFSSFALGLDAAGQFMRTDNFGLGVATGYTHYLKKSDVAGSDDFGVIPLGLMLRYYPQPEGLFVGTDLGYSFLTGTEGGETGGMYFRPQLGYHNYDWNIFAYYNQILIADPFSDVSSIGIAWTYNIRFK